MVAERCAKGQVTLDQRSHDLIDQRIQILMGNPLARYKVAVEDYEVRVLIVEDRVHNTDSFEVCIRSAALRLGLVLSAVTGSNVRVSDFTYARQSASH